MVLVSILNPLNFIVVCVGKPVPMLKFVEKVNALVLSFLKRSAITDVSIPQSILSIVGVAIIFAQKPNLVFKDFVPIKDALLLVLPNAKNNVSIFKLIPKIAENVPLFVRKMKNVRWVSAK